MAKPTATKTKTEQQPIAGEAPQGNLPALQQKQLGDFMAQFRARQRAYEPLLPVHLPFEKFESSVRAAITRDPELVTKCHPATTFRACAEAAELGLSLSPTLKEADILKVWNKRLNAYEAQFRPRYMGLMKLARQSGEITSIDGHEVYKWDEFDYEYGLNERLIHRPRPKPMDYEKQDYWGVIAAYCIWEIAGQKKFEVMELADLIRIMNRTQSKTKKDRNDPNSELIITGPWVTDLPEMCRKTVVRRASKYMPLSAENMKRFAAAVNLDDRREGGDEVTLDHGDVVDITDGGGVAEERQEQKQAEQKQQATSKLDDLESRMGATGAQQQKAQPAQQKKQPEIIDNPPQQQQQAPKDILRIEVPRNNGAADWPAWLKLSEAAVKGMSAEARTQWREKHKDLIDACEFNVPDQMDGLIKMLTP